MNNIMISYQSSNPKTDQNEYLHDSQSKVRNQEYIASASLCKEPAATFMGAMKWTILIGQVFGLIPVMGVCEKDASKVRFHFYSARCFYSLTSVLGQGMLVIICLIKIANADPTLNASLSSNSAIIFYLGNGSITVLLFGIAMKWPALCRQIAKIEAIDPCVNASLAKKCNITCIFIIAVGTVEHALSDLSGMTTAKACHPDKKAYEAFLIQNFDWIWAVLPYNLFFGIIIKFINAQLTFNWNYSDVFIMCICCYLNSRLDQINDRVAAVKGQVAPSSFWRTMREDYSKATTLVKRVDKVISGVIFVSFASNLFSICFLILHVLEDGLKPAPSSSCKISADAKAVDSNVHAVYFAFAIISLLVRSLAVSLIAARVHSNSAKPAFVLYDVPSAGYCVEVQRFLEQVHGDSVALSGLQFFSVKRGMVLTIAATIVTYELVLIQFSGVTPTAAAATSIAHSVFTSSSNVTS